MTYDELISWAIQTLPNARAVEMADGEIAILTGYREHRQADDAGDHAVYRPGHGWDLVPIDLGSDDPGEVSLDPGSGVLSGAS